MTHFLKTTLLLTTALALSVGNMCAANAENNTEVIATNDWSFDISPYLWLATYDGVFGLQRGPGGMNRNQVTTDSAYSTTLSAAAMLMGQVHYREFGLYLDGAWVQVETEGAPASGVAVVDLKTDIAYGTAALTYRLPTVGRLKSQALAGARTWYFGNELHYSSGVVPGRTRDGSRVWCDPIIGAELRYDFSKHWYAMVIGDVGGFGVGADLSWNVFGGIGFQFTRWCSLTLGYRYLHFDYEKTGFVADANIQGVLLGLGFHF